MLIGNAVGYPPQGRAAEGSPNEPAPQYDGSGQLISVKDDEKFPYEDDLPHNGHESDEEEGKGDPSSHKCYLREADRIKQGSKGVNTPIGPFTEEDISGWPEEAASLRVIKETRIMEGLKGAYVMPSQNTGTDEVLRRIHRSNPYNVFQVALKEK